MKVVFFSENSWNSNLKYQRHHLAEYLCGQEDIKFVLFLSKSSIRKIRLRDVFSMFWYKFFSKSFSVNRQKPAKLKVVNYLLFPYQRFLGWINSFLVKRLYEKIEHFDIDWSETVLISYQPIPQILDIIDKYKPKKTIYISVHDYSNMYGVSSKVVEIEKEIIQKVDLFTTDAQALFEKLSPLSQPREVPLTPACPSSVVVASQNIKFEIKEIKRLIYFGTIANYLDFGVIQNLAPKGIIVDFMGVQYDVNLHKMFHMEKSRLINPMDFEKAASFMHEYDGIILPYKINDRNDLVIPAKIYECFSLGLPVFVPEMKWTQEVSIKGLVFVYRSVDDLLHKIEHFESKDFDPIRQKMLSIASQNTWDVRFSKLYKWMKL